MIMAYVYDFVSFLFEKEIRNEIKSIILYGSVASGEFDEHSDIDIFIEIWDSRKKKTVEKIAEEQLAKFEDAATRIWYPRGIKNKFSIITGDLNSPEWKNIEYDIISNGILLYGKFEKMPENIQHMVLVSFSLSSLNQKSKMKFIRHLYGYGPGEKGKKRKSGFLDECQGIKISSNAVLIPIEKAKEFRKLLSDFRLTPQIREVLVK